MQFYGRARYNLLQLNSSQEKDNCEKWEIEDYRSLDKEALYGRLRALGVKLNDESFLLYAKSADTPRQLTATLLPENVDSYTIEHCFLLIFELWRRLLQGRAELSIFCDELDHQIELFEQNTADIDHIGDILNRLESILDGSVDDSQSPQAVFAHISNYFAHDLETFIYDFCAYLIDNERLTLASELIEGFYDYVEDRQWFDFLRMRLLEDESEEHVERFGSDLVENPNIDLCLEFLSYLSNCDRNDLFYSYYQKFVPFVRTEENFKQMLKLIANFYSDVDQELEHDFIHKLLASRTDIDDKSKMKLEQLILDALQPKES
ncbi:MAG: hypothetical protein MRY21_00440 [Simkaniaceae bacterium]|nr:hypothetical protein [Simkaniaceae bacterium]